MPGVALYLQHDLKEIPMNETIVKVGANSKPADVGGAIAHIYRERQQVAAQAIGAGAVNQMVKALAIATLYLESDGINVACVPSFVDVSASNGTITALRMELVPHNRKE
jgi:stage V sporulation protein S